ncbi:hypothetical protein Pcinc_039307 [Petrolisthes cinctipes]|uniref:Uncharacterized protein n=1 Tax=Petrolisthes cinctipes TaxID=88211 RepID=A0AAE1EJ79_PETCI|nr:hypothetical protein Pcinc_039307 [Petrolisthes cinctipes]
MVLVVSLLGSAGGQKSGGSRLHGMVMGWMDGMSSMTSRIGTGILRSLGVDRRTIVRQLPAGEQLNIARHPRPQGDNTLAPNAPRPGIVRPGKERQQPRRNNRLTFRQFVDSAMSGISKMLPRLRRRTFNRNYHVRDRRQVRDWATDRYGSEFGVDSSISSASSPGKSIHVTVNLYEESQGKPGSKDGVKQGVKSSWEESKQGGGGTKNYQNEVEEGMEVDIEEPHGHSLTVSHYPDHTVHVQHHDTTTSTHHHQDYTIPSVHDHQDYTIPSTQNHQDYTIPSTQNHQDYTIPSVHDHQDYTIPSTQDHQDYTIPSTQDHQDYTIPSGSPSHDQQMTTTTTTTKSPFHVNDWPHIDSSLEFPDLDHFFTSEFEGYPGWQGEGDVVPASEDSTQHDPNYYNPGDNLESITSDLNDEGTSGYQEFDSQDELGDGRNLQYKNGFVQGYQKGYDDGERVNSHVQGSNGTPGYAMPVGNGGPDNGGWSYGSSGNRDPSNDGWMSSSGSGGQQGSHPVNSYSVNNNPSTVGSGYTYSNPNTDAYSNTNQGTGGYSNSNQGTGGYSNNNQGTGGYSNSNQGTGEYSNTNQGTEEYSNSNQGTGGYSNTNQGTGGYSNTNQGTGGYSNTNQGTGGYSNSGVGSGPAGCGVRCLWGDLMKYLDHYSERGEEELVQVTDVEPTAATATVGGMVLAGVHGSRLHNSPQQQQPQPATTTRFSPAHKRDRGHQTYRHTKPQPPATTTTRFSPVHERDRGHQTHPYTKPQPEIQHNRKHYLNPYDRYRQRPSSTTRGRGDTGRPSYSSSWGTHHQPGPPYSTFPVRLHNIRYSS